MNVVLKANVRPDKLCSVLISLILVCLCRYTYHVDPAENKTLLNCYKIYTLYLNVLDLSVCGGVGVSLSFNMHLRQQWRMQKIFLGMADHYMYGQFYEPGCGDSSLIFDHFNRKNESNS